MLGYVQSDSPIYWNELIRQNLPTRQDLNLLDVFPHTPVTGKFPDEWLNRHKRTTETGPISIRHILLDFRIKRQPEASSPEP